ncbi:PAS domain S-box-containing protein [Rhodoblastus acidophilus]|uniref:PAS domain-containing sensor histidine kinase n=1 Tax=Rhodoblastus acidophilus TaxID=1074 RepID=UPI0022240FC4|nr:PAS domain-containing sensor histidine kinase [Rhodoblastus acidophilus]MCW2286165.1 PAS domain S-box-containing protein [Rhodoblastus acidophilus]MCW2335059.1 PAS domain S-box-containing protein [Rhodoblastus acidophilus]
MSGSSPRLSGMEDVRAVDNSEPHRLDDVEWLDQELRNAAPGRETDLMRLLLSRVTLNNMFQFCALLDTAGRMWDVNFAALRGGGLTRSDIHGQPFWEAHWWQVSEATKTRLREAIARASEGAFVRYDVDVLGGARGQEVITIDFNIAPVKDNEGAVRFLVCEGRDVTEQRRLEAEVRRQRQELARLDQLKTQFFTNVSHEFRAPLTLMLGPAADALADAEEPLGPRQRRRITLMQRNATRLLKLVNTLLDFSRLEAGRAQASCEPTDLAALTTDLASNFRSVIERAGLRFIVDCPPLPQPAYVDCDMWERIVFNLVSNAFKFTHQGEIAVTLRADNSSASLAVSDTGIGIPAEALSHIFDRFHRVEGSRGRSHEGSGIGLALAQELARLHGGEITVESAPGEGSRFSVTVPLGGPRLTSNGVGVASTLASTATAATAYVEEALQWLPDQGGGQRVRLRTKPRRRPRPGRIAGRAWSSPKTTATCAITSNACCRRRVMTSRPSAMDARPLPRFAPSRQIFCWAT